MELHRWEAINLCSIAVYGAKSIALGVASALMRFYPEYPFHGFLVSSRANNPASLAGYPVRAIDEFAEAVEEGRRKELLVLICTPEDMHPQIVHTLEKYGFKRYICMESHAEAVLTERLFKEDGGFPSLHDLRAGEKKASSVQVYMTKFHKDRPLSKNYDIPDWVVPIQAGAALAEEREAPLTDDTGDNISVKNPNYCELTALYWIWKNVLEAPGRKAGKEYCGIYHYRRVLDISETDICRLNENDIDVILPFPTLHEPDIREHHRRYVKEEDWNAMLQALQELQPEYARAFSAIAGQPCLYNYNLIIAKKSVLAEYCAWLFPILKRTEELSVPKGWERADRYIGYLGENLMTLYFLYHQRDYKIYHTGRLMLT